MNSFWITVCYLRCLWVLILSKLVMYEGLSISLWTNHCYIIGTLFYRILPCQYYWSLCRHGVPILWHPKYGMSCLYQLEGLLVGTEFWNVLINDTMVGVMTLQIPKFSSTKKKNLNRLDSCIQVSRILVVKFHNLLLCLVGFNLTEHKTWTFLTSSTTG